jgi:hypothetical protein
MNTGLVADSGVEGKKVAFVATAISRADFIGSPTALLTSVTGANEPTIFTPDSGLGVSL